MILALSYSTASQAQAQKLLNRIESLGNAPEKILLCRENSAGELETSLPVVRTNYPDNINSHVESKNMAFQAAAIYVRYHLKEPFLYIEPDCVPRTADWFVKIRDEYMANRKPYLGVVVPASQEYGTPKHMAAIGVYPADIIRHGGGDGMNAAEEPFPSAMAKGTLPQMHETLLIAHDWQGQGVPAECVLYHPDRDGKILENLPVPVLAEPERGVADLMPPSFSEIKHGEARKSIESLESLTSDSRGGQFISGPTDGSNAAAGHGSGAGDILRTDQERDLLRMAHEQAKDIPWGSQLNSIEHVKTICADLKSYCDSPSHTDIVRRELKEAKVIPYVRFRRKKRKVSRRIYRRKNDVISQSTAQTPGS